MGQLKGGTYVGGDLTIANNIVAGGTLTTNNDIYVNGKVFTNGKANTGDQDLSNLSTYSYVDNTFLKLAGGTMTNSIFLPLDSPALRFGNTRNWDSAIGHDTFSYEVEAFMTKSIGSKYRFKVGFDPANFANGAFVNMTDADLEIGAGYCKINNNTVWHSGNDGDGSGLDADTLDGVHNGNVTANYFKRQTTSLDANNPLSPYMWYYGQSTNRSNWADGGYGGIFTTLNEAVDLNAQFNWFINHDSETPTNSLFFRASNNRGFKNDWKQIAFTTSNVASATKLQTTRTIWGQSFDGTGNVSGAMTGVSTISASGNITTSGIVYTNGKANTGDQDLSNLSTYDYVDNTFLKLAGGIMTGAICMNNRSLILGDSFTDNQPDGSPWYGLRHTGGTNAVKLSGYFGISLTTGNNDLVIPLGGNPTINGNTIWHSGNDGSGSGLDADTLDGAHNGNVTAKYFSRQTASLDANNPLSPYMWYYGQSTNRSNWADGGYGGIFTTLNEAVDLNAQFNWFINHDSETPTNSLFFRASNNLGFKNDWKQIAFTTSNVASATKLQTTRTIWGQSFDGTGNVSGNLTSVGSIAASGDIRVSKDGAALYFGIRNQSYIGSNVGSDSFFWNAEGDAIRFGTGNGERMRISATGNVLIGTEIDSGYKLDVVGSGHFTSYIQVNGTINAYKNTPNGTTYNELGIQVYSGDGSPVGIGFHRGGYSQCILEHSGDGLVIRKDGVIGAGGYGNLTVNAVTASNYYLSLTNQIKTNTGYLELVSAGNEICIGGADGIMYVNYRPAANGTPTNWYWRAGTSTSFANFHIGGLNTSEAITAQNGIVTDYEGSHWLSMATRENQIKGNINASSDQAHSLYCVKNSNGDAIAFGGLGVNTGFYGFTASRIANGENGTDWSTTWNVSTGQLNHSGNFYAGGSIYSNRYIASGDRIFTGYDSGQANSISCSNWFISNGESGWYNGTYGGGITMIDSTYVRVHNNKAFKVTSTASDSINTDGGILAGGTISASGIITGSAIRTTDTSDYSLIVRNSKTPSLFVQNSAAALTQIASFRYGSATAGSGTSVLDINSDSVVSTVGYSKSGSNNSEVLLGGGGTCTRSDVLPIIQGDLSVVNWSYVSSSSVRAYQLGHIVIIQGTFKTGGSASNDTAYFTIPSTIGVPLDDTGWSGAAGNQNTGIKMYIPKGSRTIYLIWNDAGTSAFYQMSWVYYTATSIY